MGTLESEIQNEIDSLKSLRDEPKEGNAHKIIEEIKALNSIDVSDLKKEKDSCGHCGSGVDCGPSCYAWNIDKETELSLNSFDIFYNIEASDEEDTILSEVNIYDNEGNEVVVNKGELFWIEKAIQEKLAY